MLRCIDCCARYNAAGRSPGDSGERGEPMGSAPQRRLEAEMGHVSQHEMSFPCSVLSSKEYDTAYFSWEVRTKNDP